MMLNNIEVILRSSSLILLHATASHKFNSNVV